MLVTSSSAYLLVRRINFDYVELRTGSLAFSVDDVLTLEASGTTLTCKKNGTSFWTQTDSNIASGNPGVADISANALDFTAGDDWEGGDLVTAALQKFQYDWPHQLHARR